MKKRNHFFEKPLFGENAGLRAKARSPLSLLFIFSLALFQLASCTKDSVEGISPPGKTPQLYVAGANTTVTNLELGYDVVIKSRVTFQNGLGANSPGWKRLQSVPETVSYSLAAKLDEGSTYLLQDNITVRSYLKDQMLPADRMVKMETKDAVLTTYDAQDETISSLHGKNMAQGILDGFAGNINSPLDTNLLAANGSAFFVDGGNVAVVSRIAKGDEVNSTVLLDLGTSATLLELLYDDADPTKLVSLASHAYDAQGGLRSSNFTYFDYLSDGDVKRTDEQWSYSNFSLNLY